MGIFGEPLTLGFASGEPHLAIRCSEVLLQSEEAKSMEADSVLLGTSDVGPPDRHMRERDFSQEFSIEAATKRSYLMVRVGCMELFIQNLNSKCTLGHVIFHGV